MLLTKIFLYLYVHKQISPFLFYSEYRRGTQVKVQLQDLEMSAAFLGSAKHITLLEADATLIGLRRNPSSSSSSS